MKQNGEWWARGVKLARLCRLFGLPGRMLDSEAFINREKHYISIDKVGKYFLTSA